MSVYSTGPVEGQPAVRWDGTRSHAERLGLLHVMIPGGEAWHFRMPQGTQLVHKGDWIPVSPQDPTQVMEMNRAATEAAVERRELYERIEALCIALEKARDERQLAVQRATDADTLVESLRREMAGMREDLAAAKRASDDTGQWSQG